MDAEARRNYDEAVFGGLLGRGDYQQEMQALFMEARWLKSQKKIPGASGKQVYNPFPSTLAEKE